MWQKEFNQLLIWLSWRIWLTRELSPDVNWSPVIMIDISLTVNGQRKKKKKNKGESGSLQIPKQEPWVVCANLLPLNPNKCLYQISPKLVVTHSQKSLNLQLGNVLDFPTPFPLFFLPLSYAVLQLFSPLLCCLFQDVHKQNVPSFLEVPPNAWITQAIQSLWFISSNFMIMSGHGALWPCENLRKQRSSLHMPEFLFCCASLFSHSLFLLSCLLFLQSKVTPNRESVISHSYLF